MVRQPRQVPSLAMQAHRLRDLGLDGARADVIRAGAQLRFDFTARPLVGARAYRCSVEMHRSGSPVAAYVLSPDLKQLSGGKRPPHIYAHSAGRTKLCLYMPVTGEWHSGMWLSETFVPWTFEWLRYFELWLIDGEWHGGGEHPKPEERGRCGVRSSRA